MFGTMKHSVFHFVGFLASLQSSLLYVLYVAGNHCLKFKFLLRNIILINDVLIVLAKAYEAKIAL